MVDEIKDSLNIVATALAKSAESLEAHKFDSLKAHKSRIAEKNLSYEDLLDHAAIYSSSCELLEFENESLKKNLDIFEELLSLSCALSDRQKKAHDVIDECNELHESASTTRRFLEGQLAGRDAQRKMVARKGASALHASLGHADKRRQVVEAWASGKYSNRDNCAEQESLGGEISFSTARKALRRAPNPDPWPAKPVKKTKKKA